MSDPALQEAIKAGIAAHGAWKVDLDNAVATGASHRKLDDSKRDDLCALGKWLRTLNGAQQGEEYKKVMDLHAKFHTEAAKVLEMALAGKKDQAMKALDIMGPFSMTSGNLTRAMMDWSKKAG